MKRKYLDDIGVKDRPDTWCKGDDRAEKWKSQKKVYGFDERETWSLDHAFYYWLYERLMMYKDVCKDNIDLTYHKFKYNKKEYTQIEIIDMILERLEYAFTNDFWDLDKKKFKYVHEVEKLWAIVLPAMWW